MRKFLIVFILLSLIAGVVIYYGYIKEQSKAQDHLLLFGNVDVRQVDLGFRLLGRVSEMPWQEGEWVSKGAFMGRLDRQPFQDQVHQAAAALESNQIQLSNAQQALDRRKQLQGDGGVSQEDLENAQASYKVFMANRKQAEASVGIATTNLRDTELFAPNDGVILTRIREPGTIVREGDPIYTLSLITPIWVRAYVAEPDLGLIYPGMPAEVYTDTHKDKIYPGFIGFISPVSEFTPKTVETIQLRTDLVYRLRVIVDNPDQGLRQGMPVTVKLRLKTDASNGTANKEIK